jgi:predicted nucleic acid-binding protein
MILVDANVLIRYAMTADSCYPVVDAVIRALLDRGRQLRIVPQILYEFWATATRPISVNGLGLSTAECVVTMGHIERLFPLLPDQPTLLAEWKSLVIDHQCQGKVSHDARLVAAMRTHGVTDILTFNVADFRRYPGITIIDPASP